MERSTASLTYKGSISDAIVDAQKQKKLFLVYISGEDEISTQLEQSTLVDNSVTESVTRYCIFLHLVHGSLDAQQFSAIYPQKSVPSITAVGFNGVMLWQHEGYVSVEDFVGRIEKAWASLHFQETAVTLLTAALASKKPEPLNSTSLDLTEGSSSADIASTSEGKSADDSKLQAEQMVSEPIDDKDTDPVLETSSQSGTLHDLKNKGEEEISLENNIREEVLNNVSRDVSASTAHKESLALDESYAEASPVSQGKALECSPDSNQTTATVEEEKSKTEEIVEPSEYSKAVKSDDIYLNIRLLNGSNLQRKYMITDTLRSVKSYVDENQNSELGPYDLAMPYPRKVFGEQDMNSSLSELGFAGRQTLIVVPHRRASRPQRVTSSMNDSQNTRSTISSTDESAGYFAFVKRTLSYLNPFSYLGGYGNSSDSEPARNDSSQQYRPYQALQGRQLFRGESSSAQFGPNRQNPSSSDNAGETMRRTSRPFGSNIHTLRHDEDDFSSRDRNTFWNGNSTQFGGDDKK